MIGNGVRTREIRRLRPPKPEVDPWEFLDALLETERRFGKRESVVTLFLAGKECPFTCVFCDLWKYTLDRPTPVGALSRQIDLALDALGPEAGSATTIKLYNASNFFDPRAVPDEELEGIARRMEPYDRVVVESHPRFVGSRTWRFAERIGGRLEVAMGLESVHPEVLPKLNKSMTVEDFDRAAVALLAHDVSLRAFVLLGVPYLLPAEQAEWSARTVEHAVTTGAEQVTIIPVRGGNGEMERLGAEGQWTPPTLELLEDAVERSVSVGEGTVCVDLWDIDRLVSCGECGDRRVGRLESMNLRGTVPERFACTRCGWS